MKLELRPVTQDMKETTSLRIRLQLHEANISTRLCSDEDIDKAWHAVVHTGECESATTAYDAILYGSRAQANKMFRDIANRVRGKHF